MELDEWKSAITQGTLKTPQLFSSGRWQTCCSTRQLWLQRTGWALAATSWWEGSHVLSCLRVTAEVTFIKWPLQNKKDCFQHTITTVNCTNQECFQHKAPLGVVSREERQQKKIPTHQCCHRQCSLQSTCLEMPSASPPAWWCCVFSSNHSRAVRTGL